MVNVLAQITFNAFPIWLLLKLLKEKNAKLKKGN